MKRSIEQTVCAALAILAMLIFLPQPAAAREDLCDSSYQDCRAALLTLIKNETKEIDVGMWFMQDARYSNAIIAQLSAHPGLKVRILMDPRAFPTQAGSQSIADQFANAGIPMRKRIASGIEHWKVMIFDDQNTVYFGSANFSAEAFVYNQQYVNYIDETVYVTDDQSIVDSFRTRFDDAWVDTTNYSNCANAPNGSLVRSWAATSIDPELNFPPDQDYASRSVKEYNKENNKIDVMMFRITDQRHTNAIISASDRGVPVRLLVDPGQYRTPSRLWDAWNVDRLWLAGQQNGNIEVRETVHQGENHGKLVLLYGLGESIFGSSNWSSPSADSQHEENYFTKKANLFDWFVTYFERRWNNSNPAGVAETGSFTPLPPDTPAYQSIADGAVGVPLTGQRLVWDGGPWAHVYDIYFGTSPTPPLYLANQSLGPDDPENPSFQSITLPTLQPGVTYYWQIVSKTMANMTKTGSVWSFTTSGTAAPPPAPWSDTDVGAVPFAGSATYSSGTFTLTGSGADIWGTADAFNYLYQPVSGDVTLQMRVTGVQNVNSWSKAGAMIRESLDPGSTHAFALVSATKGVAFQRRESTGGTSVNTYGSTSAAPRWLRLVRSGNTFTASESSDGNTWTTIGMDTIPMAATVYVGVATTSHTTSASTTATVDNVTVTTGGGPPPPPAGQVVMWMANVPASNLHGNWQVVADGSAAGGSALMNPDAGASKIAPALANPANYFEQTFSANAGGPYHLWVRLRAQNNSQSNDSIHVQFSDAEDQTGSAFARIGTTGSAEVVLQNGPSGGADQGWGWADNGWGSLGTNLYFPASGTHTIRVQQREDGAIVDQIVLSPDTYLTSPPGPRQNDSTILPSTDGGSPPPPPPPPPLPSPWSQADIGSVPFAGSASYSSGAFSITASGADIWGTDDALHFVYQPLSGDGVIVARVGSVQNVSSWSKAGVMIRETLDAGSAHAFMLASAAKGMAFQRRNTTNGSSVNTAGSLTSPPRWVKLERAGNTFTASESADGSTWTVVGTDTIPMAANVYMGLAVTSHSTSASTTALVDSVSTTP